MRDATRRIMEYLYEVPLTSAKPELGSFQSFLQLADTPLESTDFLLRKYKRPKHKVFYDLSSGIGNAVLQTAHFNDPRIHGYDPTLGFFTKAVGFETASDKMKVAIKAFEKAINMRRLVAQVSFENKDPREATLSDADLIYFNSPALGLEIASELQGDFYYLRPETRIMLVDRMLNQQYFNLVHTAELTVNRLPSFIFVYDKK